MGILYFWNTFPTFEIDKDFIAFILICRIRLAKFFNENVE